MKLFFTECNREGIESENSNAEYCVNYRTLSLKFRDKRVLPNFD